MDVTYSARSHIGRVRAKNEDNLFVDGVMLSPEMRDCPFTIDGAASAPAIFAVCDGMGGEDDGDVASLTAIKALFNNISRIKLSTANQLSENIQLFVNAANNEIHVAMSDSTKRMGTTLALIKVTDDGTYCFNLGDSRIYCFCKGVFKQITNDHTLAAERVRAGVLPSVQADSHKLTRCIGIGEAYETESYPCILDKGRFMICSDGLTDMVDVADIENVLRASERTADAASTLLNSALENGGKDNISIIVIDVKKAKTNVFQEFTNRIMKWGRV